MAATSTDLHCTTFTWKKDPAAGDIPAYVYHGHNAAQEGPHPIILTFHAGGWVLGDASMFCKPQIQKLTDMGFVVVCPEYRLCPQVSVYEGPIQDAKDVLVWCHEQLPSLLKDAAGVQADGKKVVALGQSAGAMLALETGSCPNPPVAIIDYYGVKYIRDYTYHRPAAMFAQVPDVSEEIAKKFLEEPVAFKSKPMFVNGKPNLEDPRAAWFIAAAKKGTSYPDVVQDGDYERVEATNRFSKNFPPTIFLHGTQDPFVDYKLAVRAHEQLKALGVETEILLGDDIEHGFDIFLTSQDDPKFTKYVLPALEFAKKHV